MWLLSIYLTLVIITVVILLLEKARYVFPPLALAGAFFRQMVFTLYSAWIFSAIFAGSWVIILKFSNQLKPHYYKEPPMFSDFLIM